MNEKLPALALSVRQPWAWAIIHAGKDIENRSWATKFRGRVLIHASKGMTQEEFAGRFGFSVNTLRHWEQGKRQPEGATRAYLLVIDRAPKAVQKALHAA